MFKAKSKTYCNLFIFLAIAVAAFFAATSLVNGIEGSSDKIRNQKILLSRLDEQKGQIGRIRADYQNQKKEMEKIKESFLDSEKTVDFVVEIERIARKALVGLETKTTEKMTEKNEAPPAFNYQIIVTGKFNNVMHFLEYLENIKYNIKINGLKISAAENGIEAIVDLEVYVSG